MGVCYSGEDRERPAMPNSSVLDRRKPRARRVADLPAHFRERVLAALPGQVERIVLFGSQARAEAHGESDWDFAVFLANRPSEEDRRRIRAIGDEVWRAFDAEVQTLVFDGSKWLARDELACNIRDHGLTIYGPDDAPMIERPVLEHARDALSKAERFAELACGTPDDRFEGVVHGSYYAMFHAARAVLLVLEGNASTNHGRVVKAFGQMAKRRRLGAIAMDFAKTLGEAHELRGEADYGNKDLTEAGRQLRARVAPFLDWARSLVEHAGG
jgi:uncharacterized protein (UPF0332 family)/predicted nucleotidyltransferase